LTADLVGIMNSKYDQKMTSEVNK